MAEIPAPRKNPEWPARYAEAVTPQFLEFLALEDSALHIWNFENAVIPELLQTADYAGLMLKYHPTADAQSDTETELTIRMRRQRAIVSRKKKSSFLIAESVLKQVFGTPEVHRNQLLRLKDLAGRPNVSIRVVPDSVLSDWDSHSFTLTDNVFPGAGYAVSYRENGHMLSIRSKAEKSETETEPLHYVKRFAELETKALSIMGTIELIDSLTGPVSHSSSCWGL